MSNNSFASFLASSKGSSKNLYTQHEWRVMIGLQAYCENGRKVSVAQIAGVLPGRTKLSVQTTLYNFTTKCKEIGVEQAVAQKAGCSVEECIVIAKKHVEDFLNQASEE